jgi:aminoglycoside 3-N-acetyltransferase
MAQTLERPTAKIGGITYNQIVRGLRAVGLSENSRVIVHSSLSSFGYILGGAQTVVGALTAVCGTVIAPSFTYQTLLVPRTGPELNGMGYEEPVYDAEFFAPDMPAHRTIGNIPNALLKHPNHWRSNHPALSFVGVGRDAEAILGTQSYEDPFAPLSWLADNGGDVLLMGVTHRTNTSIHVGEWRAGRPPFTRWSLAQGKAVEFKWPGDSSGFDAITPHIRPIVTHGQIGQANIQRIPSGKLVEITTNLIRKDPFALLCFNDDCDRCRDMRVRIQDKIGQ